jgi:5'-nucleotidase
MQPWCRWLTRAGLLLLLLSSMPVPVVQAHEHGDCRDDTDASLPELRARARDRISKRSPKFHPRRANVKVQILGFNDFHGQLSAGRLVAGRPVGSAAVLASYLAAEQAAFEGESFIAHAGDHVGASPAASALLQDEPSIMFLNMLGNKHCRQRFSYHPACNVIGTLGNHEFDDGVDEMLRLIQGGNHSAGPFLESPYRGAAFPYVCANVVDAETGEHVLPPYVIRRVKGVGIGFIGAVLKETPTVVTPSGVAGVLFLDEVEAINAQVKALRRRGVEAIIVQVHQGGPQTSYTGPTSPDAAGPGGAIAQIVQGLDGAVDVVISGHAHSFTNAYMQNASGDSILVTQAFSASTAYGDIELALDPYTGDVVESSAAIVTTWADEGPGLTPVAEVAALTKAAEDAVAPLIRQVVGVAARDLTRAAGTAGESTLGNLIADAQRAAMATDFAFMNPGGIRADLAAGEVTWGELFTVQPFGNSLVAMSLSGSQITHVLEQQWLGQPFARIMQISGLGYTWDPAAPVGSRVVEVHSADGSPLDPASTYSVACNSFMATGGDNFTLFAEGTDRVGGPVDLDALIDYVRALPQPFDSQIEGRITVP